MTIDRKTINVDFQLCASQHGTKNNVNVWF